MPKQIVPGNNALTVSDDGAVLFKMPHGTFYSSVTQTNASTTATGVLAFEKEVDVERLGHDTVTNNSRVYISHAGSYEILFSGIAHLTTGALGKKLHVFIKVDGTPVPDSNTITALPTLTTEVAVAVSFIYDFAVGQYWELGMYGDALTVQWLATSSGVTPACPSVVVTCKRISAKLPQL